MGRYSEAYLHSLSKVNWGWLDQRSLQWHPCPLFPVGIKQEGETDNFFKKSVPKKQRIEEMDLTL